MCVAGILSEHLTVWKLVALLRPHDIFSFEGCNLGKPPTFGSGFVWLLFFLRDQPVKESRRGCCCSSRNIFFPFLSSAIHLKACHFWLPYVVLKNFHSCRLGNRARRRKSNWFSAAATWTRFPSNHAAPPESQRVLLLNILWFLGAFQHCPRIFWNFNDLTACIFSAVLKGGRRGVVGGGESERREGNF